MPDTIKTHSIDDAKFYPLLDPGDECNGGAAPSYDDGIDIGCVKEVSWEENVTEQSDRGDNRICTRVSRLDEVTVTVRHAGLNMALAEAMRNYALASFTAGGVDGRTLDRTFGQQLVRGAIIARAPKPDGSGDMHIIFWNVEVTMGPGGSFADDAFLESAFTARADASLYAPCDKAYRYNEHETAVVDIPTTWPGETDY